MISGALEPRAMSVRLATVPFQTWTSFSIIYPCMSLTLIVLVAAVITVIESMKMSEMIDTPTKM
jgi:hypothetical protein